MYFEIKDFPNLCKLSGILIGNNQTLLFTYNNEVQSKSGKIGFFSHKN